MNGRFLLDTSAITAAFQGDPSVNARIQASSEQFISSTAFGELYVRALLALKRIEAVEQITHFMNTCSLLVCDADTAYEYGKIKVSLRQ